MNIVAFFLCFASLNSSPAIVLAVAGSQETARTTPTDTEVCAEQKCSPTGPSVRFPFMIRGKQPEHCGYDSGYTLHCDELNRTVLELPSSSIKVEVIRISYLDQMMLLQSLQPCLAKHLTDLDFSFSTTPFRYPTEHDYYLSHFFDQHYDGIDRYDVEEYSLFNCSLFNCSSSTLEGYYDPINIKCLGNNGSNVYAFRHGNVYPGEESCTKMYETKLVPSEMLQTDFMTLSWTLPLCQRCEGEGGTCRWKNGSSNQIVCLGGNKHHEIMKKLYISGPIVGCLFFMILATSAVYLAYSRNKQDKENQVRLKKFLEDYAAMKPTRYSYADIKKITNDFKDKLGGGAYGNVFKGKVSNDIFVAVKLLHNSTENGEEFINEVGTMGKIHHINVVRLLGFCADGYDKALVYEFLPNGSLDKFIFPDGQQHTLAMEILQAIAIGIARGIEYLHQGCEQRILHFDIKPHNILLDENYNPKLSDFGLAKLCEKGRSAVSMTAARGTMGYIAPEVFSRQFGNVSYKSDIYSFGMLLLEMVGRRKNINSNVQNISQVYFPEWVYGRLIKGEELRIQVDEKEAGEDKIAKRLAVVGLWCIQWNPVNRPSIKYVLQMLEGTAENLILPPNPFASASTMNLADSSKEENTRPPLGFTLDVISESE